MRTEKTGGREDAEDGRTGRTGEGTGWTWRTGGTGGGTRRSTPPWDELSNEL